MYWIKYIMVVGRSMFAVPSNVQQFSSFATHSFLPFLRYSPYC